MSFFRRLRILIVVVVFALFVGGFLLYKMKLPKPQTVSATGQIAPDFSLIDQSSHPFRLADQRGHRVLLIFYRGYW
jgi:cytochrome oxidase Cu insertion factor (SCO1/SenC/PrrC family)